MRQRQAVFGWDMDMGLTVDGVVRSVMAASGPSARSVKVKSNQRYVRVPGRVRSEGERLVGSGAAAAQISTQLMFLRFCEKKRETRDLPWYGWVVWLWWCTRTSKNKSESVGCVMYT